MGEISDYGRKRLNRAKIVKLRKKEGLNGSARARGSAYEARQATQARPPTERALEALLRRMSRAAERCFAEHGEIANLMWLLENTAGKQWTMGIVTRPGLDALDAKDELTAVLRQKFREWSVCRYAWFMRSEVTPEAYAAMGYTLENAPERRECVLLKAEDERQFLCAFREIHRPSGRKPYLGALQIRSNAAVNRLGGLLRPADEAGISVLRDIERNNLTFISNTEGNDHLVSLTTTALEAVLAFEGEFLSTSPTKAPPGRSSNSTLQSPITANTLTGGVPRPLAGPGGSGRPGSCAVSQHEGLTMQDAAVAYSDPSTWLKTGFLRENEAGHMVPDTSQDEWRRHAEASARDLNEVLLRRALREKLTRGELLARGFPNAGRVRLVDIPPAFWEGSSCSLDYEADIAWDHQGRGYTQVRILPMPKSEAGAPAHRDLGGFDYKVAVIKYRQYHKEHGKDPDDPNTKAPTEKEDMAVTKLLFGVSVPEKTLRAMRKEIWRSSQIRRGRPPKFG